MDSTVRSPEVAMVRKWARSAEECISDCYQFHGRKISEIGNMHSRRVRKLRKANNWLMVILQNLQGWAFAWARREPKDMDKWDLKQPPLSVALYFYQRLGGWFSCSFVSQCVEADQAIP